ncbi:MAG: hypothetical protein NVS2B14_02160 [Chamaesiphon sp.]
MSGAELTLEARDSVFWRLGWIELITLRILKRFLGRQTLELFQEGKQKQRSPNLCTNAAVGASLIIDGLGINGSLSIIPCERIDLIDNQIIQ